MFTIESPDVLSFTWTFSLAIAISLASVVYGLCRAFYILHLHPLSNIPGPKLAAISQIPIAVTLKRGTLSHWLLGLHEHYSSDLIRISPEDVSIISPSALKDIYASRRGQASFPKDIGVFAGEKSIVTANDADHCRMRKLLDYAFSGKALKEQEVILQTHVDELIRGLKGIVNGSDEGKTDLVNWYQWIAFDNIGDLSFGQSFHCLTTARFHPWVANLKLALKFIALASIALRFPLLKGFLNLFLTTKTAREGRAAMRQLAHERVEKRLHLETKRPDFMTYIMAQNDTKKGLTREEIDVMGETMIAAGSETIAGLLCGFTWYVLRHPDVLQKVQDEVRRACQKSEDVKLQNVESLEYLGAVVNEVFRIYPTTLAGQPRIIPSGGATICGEYLPEGTGIQMNQLAAFNSSRNFSHPSMFAPERWLKDKREIFKSDKTNVLQPFSVGPRNCIGKKLAMAEIQLILARMLWEFDMEMCDETCQDWPDQRAWITWEQKPLIVRLKVRKST